MIDLHSVPTEKCLWERLSSCNKPVVMYGTGNGGDKILDECQKRGIKISGVFASSGFVRRRVWRGMEVLSYEEALARFGEDIVILLAFGSALPEVMANFHTLDDRHEFYIPDVPLYGGEVFDREYFRSHSTEIRNAFSSFADDTSRALFRDILMFRLTGKINYLSCTSDMSSQITELLDCGKIKTVIDCGAYKGDSTEIFRCHFTRAEYIIAMEPDPSTFRKLSAYCDGANKLNFPNPKLMAMNCAVGDSNRMEMFNSRGSRGSAENAKDCPNGRGMRRTKLTMTDVRKIDTVAENLHADFIKMDVEGSEAAALAGACRTIARDNCALAVSVYHHTDDLFSIPLYIRSKYPDHRIYLRRENCIPAWDITLWAVPDRLSK